MQKALFIGIGTQLNPVASTLEIMDFLRQYGPTLEKTLIEHFSKYAIEVAVQEGFVEESGTHYSLSKRGACGIEKSVHDLSEVELDFFVGRAVGKEVFLRPFVPSMPELGMDCLEGNAPYTPTVSWEEARRLMNERGVRLLFPPPAHPWVAETPNIKVEAPNPCLAICKCVLASTHGLSETYLCDWRGEHAET